MTHSVEHCTMRILTWYNPELFQHCDPLAPDFRVESNCAHKLSVLSLTEIGLVATYGFHSLTILSIPPVAVEREQLRTSC